VTPSEREIVRASFAEIALMPEVAGALFYERLFSVNPQFRALFKDDMRVQGMKLMTMLATIVSYLDDPREIAPAMRDMRQRHVAYGVKDADYDAVADSLLWMVEQIQGDAFTPVVRDAWMACYEALAREMRTAPER
jgi:hemoglobin-like flavoprotein